MLITLRAVTKNDDPICLLDVSDRARKLYYFKPLVVN